VNVSENVGEVLRDAICAVLSGVLCLEGSDVGQNFGVGKGCCMSGKDLG